MVYFSLQSVSLCFVFLLLCVSFVFSPQVFSFCISPCIVWCYSYCYGGVFLLIPDLQQKHSMQIRVYTHLNPQKGVDEVSGEVVIEKWLSYMSLVDGPSTYERLSLWFILQVSIFLSFCSYFVFVVLSFIYRFVSLLLEVFPWLKKKFKPCSGFLRRDLWMFHGFRHFKQGAYCVTTPLFILSGWNKIMRDQ